MKHLSLLFVLCMLSLSLAIGQTPAWPANTAAAAAQPNQYGYTWKTNSDPTGPTYNWIDITTIGTEIAGLADDNVIGPFNLEMDFKFYWNSFSEVYVGSNGYLSFQAGNIASTANGFPPTPTPTGPNAVIAAFMCDLSFSGAGNVSKAYQYRDDINNRFIVSFEEVAFWTDAIPDYSGANSFQFILDGNDSTITVQYASQTGNWNPGYDASANPMVVGIENVTGTLGLLVSNGPAAEMPMANTAITYYPPTVAGIDVRDIEPIALQNDENGGFFIPWSPPGSPGTPNFRFNTKIANVGNINVTSPTTITATVRDTTGQLLFFDNQNVLPTMAQGEVVDIQFPTVFNPPFTGPYLFNVEVSNQADINALNNSRTVEAVIVDTLTNQQEIPFSYVSDNNFNIDGQINWASPGNSGGGVLFESYGYPALITAVEFFNIEITAGATTDGFIFEIYGRVDTANAPVPGQFLYRDTVAAADVTLPFGWTRVNLPTPIVIQEGGFYVSWIQLDQNLVLATETAAPISRRTYEILSNAWAQYRSVGSEDLYIRAIVDGSFAVVNPPTSLDQFTNLEMFTVSPNPSEGIMQVAFELKSPQHAAIKVMDMQGRKVFMEFTGAQTQYRKTLDLSHLAPGMYTVQLLTDQGQRSERIVIR